MLEDENPATPFDTAALHALEATLSASDGVDIDELLATLDEHFARPRSSADIQAFREARKPWKKLADEVVPVAASFRQTGAAGRVRFPLNDQPTDAWVRQFGSDCEAGIEVTRVLARSKVETAKSMPEKGAVPGFLGLADDAPASAYKRAKDRGRLLNSRDGIEKVIEKGIAKRLVGKSDPKFQGQTLLMVTPIGSAPDHDWGPMLERLQPVAEKTAFDRIVLVDEVREKQPVLLLDRSGQPAAPASVEI
jgi:hypothetical protein